MNPSDRSHADIAARKYSSVVVTVTLLAMMWSIARWFHCRSCSQSLLDHALPATALPGRRRRWPSLREPTVVDDTSIDPTTVPIITAKFIMISTCWRLAFLCPSGFNSALNGGEKNAFCDLFVTATTLRFTHFLADNFREISTQNVNRCHQNFGNRISKWFRKGSFSPKKLILGFYGYTCGARPAALTFRPMANLRHCALYSSRRAKNVCTSVAFFIRLTVFKT